MRAYLGLEGFRREAALSTWLARIAANAFNTHIRSEMFRRGHLEAMDAEPASGRRLWESSPPENPHEVLCRKEFRELVAGAIRKLPGPAGKAIWLRYAEDRTYLEIAETLRAPLGTVKTWLYRGRQQLKQELQASGQEQAGWGTKNTSPPPSLERG